MFENTRHRFQRTSDAPVQASHGMRGRFMTRKGGERDDVVVRQPEFSPVHGRHCICDRCLRLRQS